MVKRMIKQNINSFLTERGHHIYDRLIEHVRTLGLMEIDELEIAMLANSFDNYLTNAEFINKNGVSLDMGTRGYSTVRPEFTAMRMEIANINKLSGKFGLTPGDRAKIFNIKKLGEKKKTFDL